MDKLKYIKFEESQGQYTNSIPIGVDSKNVDLKTGYNLEETLGDYDLSKGTIEDRLSNNYTNVTHDTVFNMINDSTLKNGFIVKTLGYYTINDGGAATYQIVNIQPDTPYEKLNNQLFAKLITNSNYEINVLQIGIKNDASEDISEIVNKYTEKYELFFPSGKYLISKPLYLIKSIRGSGNVRGPYAKDKGRTMFILDNSFSGDSAINIINDDSSLSGTLTLNLKDFSIDMNEKDGNGIYINQGVHRIDSITIFNIRNGIGLYANYPAERSRALYITNCSFHGVTKANSYYNNTGIYLSNHVVDCILSTIEIMNVKIGMVVYNYITMSDIHIYTGHNAVSDSRADAWWSETVGIIANNALIHATNIYLDSCHHLIQYDSNANIRIQNLMNWTNTGTATNGVTDGIYFYDISNSIGYLSEVIIDINGFDYYPRGKYQSLFRMESRCDTSANISLKNAKARIDGYLDINTIRLIPTTYQSENNYLLTMYNNEISNNSRIVEVAIADIQSMSNGYVDIYVTEVQTGASYKITIERNSTWDISAHRISRNTKDNITFYYELLDTNVYRIYASLPVTNRIGVRVESSTQTKTCVNLGAIKGLERKYYIAKEVDNTEGLIRIPKSGNRINHFTLSMLGLEEGCSINDILSAIDFEEQITLTIPNSSAVTDIPYGGELYITKAYQDSAIHRTRLELRSAAQSTTYENFQNTFLIGFFEYRTKTCYWYKPTLTLIT